MANPEGLKPREVAPPSAAANPVSSAFFNLTIAPDNTAVTQTAAISPLAIAFMVGYAADVFLSFLEGLIHTFGRTRSDPSSSPPA